MPTSEDKKPEVKQPEIGKPKPEGPVEKKAYDAPEEFQIFMGYYRTLLMQCDLIKRLAWLAAYRVIPELNDEQQLNWMGDKIIVEGLKPEEPAVPPQQQVKGSN